MLGHFAPAGCDDEVAGTLRWSVEDGAEIVLIDRARSWSQGLDSPPYTVHGRLADGGILTLLGAWTKRISMGRVVEVVRSSTLALGEFTSDEALWTRAIYSTANQAEWRLDTGLYSEWPDPDLANESPPDRPRPVLQVGVSRPTRDEVALPNAALAFDGETSVAEHGSEWSIATGQVLIVDPREAMTMRDLHREFAQPLTALTSFAADYPDGLTREVLRNLDDGQRVDVWRMDSRRRKREWQDGDRFLFTADLLDDYPDAIQRWWRLYDETWPAIGVFGDHIAEGSIYSPGRLITLYSAMEAYASASHGTKDLRRLRDYAGISSDATGCTNAALDLLGASRGYFAHLANESPKYPRSVIQDNLVLSVRRGHALMQACLLRDLGLSADQAELALRKHHRNWPLI